MTVWAKVNNKQIKSNATFESSKIALSPIWPHWDLRRLLRSENKMLLFLQLFAVRLVAGQAPMATQEGLL